MRRAQLALSRFLPLIRWQHFRRRNINAEILISEKAVSAFGCSDNEQAIVWLLRTDSISKSGMLNRDVQPLSISAGIPGLKHGRYMVTCWDTSTGKPVEAFDMKHTGNGFFQLPIQKIPADLAFAVRRTGE
jgi:mannan endo-1,4-beta-mannosidase